ncbi:hypothetical protein CC80DRAFT_120725 [Byssothecium circinans]|uniref:Uncharacterized protein n=1 Tax=Byssothecium circinans TaxID=147558 RepID=A0A6A5TNR9_9PLEO|nr:hypothetical protein CC80DRAFT_120725 [Byssothecium circinans]
MRLMWGTLTLVALAASRIAVTSSLQLMLGLLISSSVFRVLRQQTFFIDSAGEPDHSASTCLVVKTTCCSETSAITQYEQHPYNCSATVRTSSDGNLSVSDPHLFPSFAAHMQVLSIAPALSIQSDLSASISLLDTP